MYIALWKHSSQLPRISQAYIYNAQKIQYPETRQKARIIEKELINLWIINTIFCDITVCGLLNTNSIERVATTCYTCKSLNIGPLLYLLLYATIFNTHSRMQLMWHILGVCVYVASNSHGYDTVLMQTSGIL